MNLRPESPALSAFAEIQPLLTVSQKAHNEFYEKMIKYWSNRTEAMQKSVTSIHDFLKPLIDIYHEFVTREKEIEENVAEQTKNLSNASNEILNQLEDELSLKINEIETLIDQNEINIRVKDCKAILNKIEAEYRSFYEKANDGYVSIPAKVGDLFQSCETRVLQILKMRKTAENPDLITSSTLLPTHSSNSKENQSRPSTASSSSKKGGRRSKSKPPPEPAIPIILFNFSIKNGAKFEELEPLELIPHFDNFSENEATTPSSMTSQRSGKGKGKAPPPRPKRGQKNTKQATSNTIPEIEMPNLPLLSNVLQINGEPSITIFVPDNSIINDFVNNFRQKLLTSLHQSYSDAAVIAQHEADKFKLTDQLNERLRTHSPRANGIELNIAQQRVMSVESRKLKLSKFFTNFATSFNKSLNTLHESINERLTNITSDAEKLHHFIDDLYKVQASREFPQLHHIQQKDFEMYLTNRNEVIDNLNIEIETFKKHFEEIINRFVESYIASNKSNMKGSQLNLLENSNTTNNSTNESLNDCNDPEDSAMCAAIVAKVNEQMNLLLDGTKTQEKNAIDSTDLIVNKTKEEFESQFPHHVADVKFLEELSTLLNSAILKYNALMFKNKQMDDELKLAVENLETTRNLELDLQQKIARLIESVDKVRISFLRRATFLGCLKTTSFVSSPIVVVLDLTKIGENDPTSELTNNLMNSGKDLPRPTSRSRNRNSSPDKKRKSPVSSKKLNSKTSSKQNTKNSKFETAPTDSSNSLPDSLVSQINAIGQQLNQDIVHATNDYLNQVKSRKSQITRPELIPSNVNEISDKMKAKWNEYITESKNVIKKSTHSLMTFLIDTIQSIKLTIDLTFELYLEFSVKMNSIIEQTQRLHDEFEVKIKEYQIQREEYRDKLNPKTVDANNINVLNQLIVDERTIYNDEKTVIENHRNTIIGFETSEMNLFISNLIVISNSYLQIFDNFMFVEDTTYKHRISNATRRTMTDMLREKTRIQQQQQMLQQQTNSNVADPFYVPGRPFKMREWGQLDSVMSSIKNIDELTANIKNNKPDDLNAMNNSQDLQLSQELLQNPPQSSSLSNQKDQPKQIQSSPSSLGIKKSRSISRKRSEKGLANIQPPSDPDKTPIQKSLETTTHRCVMIARNKVYHQYEMTLNERLKKFLCHMHKLASECESFEKHFQTCVLNMKPDANLNVEMVPSEKPPPKSSSSHRRKRK
ncbi:hypothetical protein TRFO_38971 [Tritrichomonas foetus]|uniref:DUF4456 domain-containing protein n=1 Tax=Tritrichomonas foetus TaxID=1144522 RepID=A0A1J4J6H9_9EUKA|nr:hypothetical protein TRFO_38971 [Tritrichomonas foetus]|eukprot:OHS94830.1 hypothetical protein TRFO_38971 [Tritrichomonas foetus]